MAIVQPAAIRGKPVPAQRGRVARRSKPNRRGNTATARGAAHRLTRGQFARKLGCPCIYGNARSLRRVYDIPTGVWQSRRGHSLRGMESEDGVSAHLASGARWSAPKINRSGSYYSTPICCSLSGFCLLSCGVDAAKRPTLVDLSPVAAGLPARGQTTTGAPRFQISRRCLQSPGKTVRTPCLR